MEQVRTWMQYWMLHRAACRAFTQEEFMKDTKKPNSTPARTARNVVAGFMVVSSMCFAQSKPASSTTAGTSAPSPGPTNVNVVNTPSVFVTGTPTVNATITGSNLTNTGVLGSKIINLVKDPNFCPTTGFRAVGGDGTSSCFTMANYPGQALVITDVDWIGGGAPGIGFCTLGISLPSGGGGAYNVFLSTAAADAAGNAYKNEHMTTGVRITINPNAIGISNCLTFTSIVMRGYLVPNL
jgi:hypothetical protein